MHLIYFDRNDNFKLVDVNLVKQIHICDISKIRSKCPITAMRKLQSQIPIMYLCNRIFEIHTRFNWCY